MKNILLQAKKDAELEERGYTVIDFLSPGQVQTLFDFYSVNPNKSAGSFHTTHFSTDLNYKKGIQKFILETLQQNFKQHFTIHHPVFANFMVKEGGGNNPMPLHADWTYVDENISSSYAVWIPLIDTSVENGCIGVIPFSHRLSYHIRGPRILQWLHPTEEKLINTIGQLLPMKTGQVLIYNHRTLHYSPPNNSSQVRPAINISLVPPNEATIHYTMPEGENQVLKFEVSETDFFLDYDNFQMPRHGKMIERIELPSIPMLNERVDVFLDNYKARGLRSYLKKMFA